MAIEIRKAQKNKSKLRLALVGPSGTGKTWSSLKIAKGIGDKILVGDTESGSAELYADSIGFDYDVAPISAPYTPSKYIEVIDLAEANGYDIVILDSLTHAWAGEGGLLDQQGSKADSTGNSWTAWRTVTPQHNALVERLLNAKLHVIVTMRAKTEYVQEKDDKGKTVVKKVGLAPIQRDGLEYEFTTVLDINYNHQISASKDRTSLFENIVEKPSEKTGQRLKEWLESGKEPVKEKTVEEVITDLEAVASIKHFNNIKNKYGMKFKDDANFVKAGMAAKERLGIK